MSGTLILTAADVLTLVPPVDCIAAVEAAFAAEAREPGRAGVLGIPVAEGGFHIKAATLRTGRHYFAAKLNGNFPGNPVKLGLPTIQGMLALCDADHGRLLALMDSAELTRLRTGAATAVAARYLARPDARTVTLVGCGRQAPAQIESLQQVLPLKRVFTHDHNPESAQSLARALEARLGLEARSVARDELAACTRASDVIITCTPARRYFLTRELVAPGTFVAAVGADAEGKQEIEPALLAASTVVADVAEQCAAIGELRYALEEGLLSLDRVRSLAQVVAGQAPGRSSPSELTLFDSTGTALEDVAVAALGYERACRDGRGFTVHFDPAPTPFGEAPCSG